MQFILASSNDKKAEEFSNLFADNVLSIIPAAEKIEVVEDGHSYYENSLKKAQAYFEHFAVPTVSDDSGLNVEVLPNELGIHSARFGGDDLDFNQRMDLLLEKMSATENRKAHFTCVLCFYFSPRDIYFFEGRLDGHILKERSGSYGFGYDAIFSPLKHGSFMSLAELPDWKRLHSHRAQAANKAEVFFREMVCQSPRI